MIIIIIIIIIIIPVWLILHVSAQIGLVWNFSVLYHGLIWVREGGGLNYCCAYLWTTSDFSYKVILSVVSAYLLGVHLRNFVVVVFISSSENLIFLKRLSMDKKQFYKFWCVKIYFRWIVSRIIFFNLWGTLFVCMLRTIRFISLLYIATPKIFRI